MKNEPQKMVWNVTEHKTNEKFFCANALYFFKSEAGKSSVEKGTTGSRYRGL